MKNVLRLSELINVDKCEDGLISSLIREKNNDNPTVIGITSDSREVRPGYLFAALPGTKQDGARFIEDAISRGAVAVVAKDQALNESLLSKTTIITASNPHLKFAKIAALFFPEQPEYIVAVTGTNGKTSVVEYTRQLWKQLGHKSASLGTLGLIHDHSTGGAGLTTPDPARLHRLLRCVTEKNIDRMAIEASSHGLDQYRLDGVRIKAAAFTNLSQDHLDYHSDMQSYLSAKIRLFSDILLNDGVAVLNADGPEFKRIKEVCLSRKIETLTFGRANADIRILGIRPCSTKQDIILEIYGDEYNLQLPLVGEFQALNALTALGLILAVQKDPVDKCIEALRKLHGVPGRLEHVATHSNGAPIIVDFAHTPEALSSVLSALRSHVLGRLICVFGAGGGRDRGKRQLMGKVSEDLADLCIITDDNPRDEPPEKIRREILLGCPSGLEIGDRGDAIKVGISQLKSEDLLLIAGKGHETKQIIGNETIQFSDAEFVRETLKNAVGPKS